MSNIDIGESIQNSTFGVEYELCVCLVDNTDEPIGDTLLSILNSNSLNEQFIFQHELPDYSKWQLVDLSIKCGYKSIQKEIQTQLYKVLSTKVAIRKEEERLKYDVSFDKNLIYKYQRYNLLLDQLLEIYSGLTLSGQSDDELRELIQEMEEEMETDLNDDEDIRYDDEESKIFSQQFIKDSIKQIDIELGYLLKFINTTGLIQSEHSNIDEQSYFTLCQTNMLAIELVSRIYRFPEIDSFNHIVSSVIFNDKVFYEMNTSQGMHISIGNQLVKNNLQLTKIWLRNLLRFWFKFEKSILDKIPSFRLAYGNDFAHSVQSKLKADFIDSRTIQSIDEPGNNESFSVREQIQLASVESRRKKRIDMKKDVLKPKKEKEYENWELYYARDKEGKNIFGQEPKYTTLNIKGIVLEDDKSITYSENVFVEFRMLPNLPNIQYVDYWIRFLSFISSLSLSDDYEEYFNKRSIDNIFAKNGKFGDMKELWIYLKSTKNVELMNFFDLESKYTKYNPSNVTMTEYAKDILDENTYNKIFK
jgi:hypothetical protein|uniref:Uncharacterized protein n=1 Tax=viral metagenome TaxID=1070528 RepID=A0A6C0J2C2_9ZZZZ